MARLSFALLISGKSLSTGLPSLRATALTLWRGHPIAGLASGGLFLRREGRWQEARSSFPTLEVRALLEGPGGELWIVGNRHLGYHGKLKRLFRGVEQVAATPKFVILKAIK